MWDQQYTLIGQGCVVSAVIASFPILVVMLLLGLARVSVWIAGLAGLATAAVIAVGLLHMPPSAALGAATYGAAFGVFPILWIICWALVLFRVTEASGRFEQIKSSIKAVTSDAAGQALLVAFGFEAFLEGAAGFGTPVAIAASVLVGLGFSPLRAAVICLLANTAPVAFGSLGIPVITLAGITNLSLHDLSLWVAILGAPLAFIMPAYMLASVGGLTTLRRSLFPAIASGAVFAFSQVLVVSTIGPQLADIIAAVLSILTLVVLFRCIPGNAVAWNTDCMFRDIVTVEERHGALDSAELHVWRTLSAWMPYVLLVGFVLVWNLPRVQSALNEATVHVGWPHLDGRIRTGQPLTAAAQMYGARFLFNPLAAAGTACMAATISAAIFCRMRPTEFLSVLLGVLRQIAVPAATICIVLGMAFLMNYSGETAVIGLALAHTGHVFPVFSAVLGWLGVFLTGSDTSSNALFGNLQVVTASSLHLDPVQMAAANSVGGVMGKMISLQTIAVAAAATGMDRLAQNILFRRMLRHSVLLTVFAGLLTLLAVHIATR